MKSEFNRLSSGVEIARLAVGNNSGSVTTLLSAMIEFASFCMSIGNTSRTLRLTAEALDVLASDQVPHKQEAADLWLLRAEAFKIERSRHEARRAIEKAIAIYEELLLRDPVYLPKLASSLRLSLLLTDEEIQPELPASISKGRAFRPAARESQELIRSAEQTIAAYDQLVDLSEDYVPMLAESYESLAVGLRQAGRLREAQNGFRRAANLYKGLRSSDPDRYTRALRSALIQLREAYEDEGNVEAVSEVTLELKQVATIRRSTRPRRGEALWHG